ncbi:hypothetical protein LTR37_007348 [Vermiconidia calcicola]|uniref:Uncharacterized protein n=1 Tax=Vermiconidia calcicola TaxID=1690605 RepID=A0ACC3NEB3_9PEZI|nr:hypothetical protein LTR37_007348 [Vermiconidia calcicola]
MGDVMASHTQTEMGGLKHRNTAPVKPDSKKGLSFFKRHLGTRRRSSPTKSAMRKASVSSSNHDKETVTSNGTDATDGRNGSVFSAEENVPSPSDFPTQAPRQDSKQSGVKWAAGYADERPGRPRRASSAGTNRRGSIYLRGVEGGFLEGVDAGVGSKARRLSVHIPDHLEVEEVPLADHFSIFARAGKKDIGEGGAALVRLMQSKTASTSKDKLVAVKEFREWDSQEEQEWDYIRKIKSEYAIAKACEHPNIVATSCLCYSDKKWFHVMEYCDLGDLNDLINKGYFSIDDRNCMFKQLLRGVDYLHARGIAHRDLKSENLLLTKSGCLKIADFGTAEVFCGTHPGLKGCRRPSIIEEGAEIKLCEPGLVGSRPYTAPEIIEHKVNYDPRGVDVWSCAIVYLTLCLGGTPWDSASAGVKNYNIYCHTWDEWLEKYPDGIIQEGRPLPKFASTKQFLALGDVATKRLMMGMLHPDPSKRWSAHDALDTKLVTEFECCQQEGYSDDIKTRQRKVLHNHVPPEKKPKGHGFLKPR